MNTPNCINFLKTESLNLRQLMLHEHLLRYALPLPLPYFRRRTSGRQCEGAILGGDLNKSQLIEIKRGG